jgi:hypothetical protein
MEGRIQLRSVRSVMAKARHCGGFTWGRRYHVAIDGMAIRCTQKRKDSTEKHPEIMEDMCWYTVYIYMIYEDILTEHDSRTAGRSQIWAILWMAWRSHTYSRSFCKPRFFPQNQHDFVLPGDVSAKGAEDLRSPVPKRRRSNWAVMLIRCQSSGNPSLSFRDEGEDSRKI